MFTQTNKSNIRTGMTLAALALTAAVCPAQTQAQNIGGFNSFFPSGPRILSPLGGGVINSANFNTGLGFNSQFANFNGQLNAFNNQRMGFAQQGADYNTQLANFNAQRTAYNNQFAQSNSAPNMPLSNFTVLNPSVNPGVANGSGNGSFGFSGFNSFNALNSGVNGFGTLNSGFTNFNALNATGFGGAGVPLMAQPQTIMRARPAYNPTLPNPPASLYPSANGTVSASQTQQVDTMNWRQNQMAMNGQQPTWVGPYGVLNRTNPFYDSSANFGTNGQQPTWVGPYGVLNRTNPFYDAGMNGRTNVQVNANSGYNSLDPRFWMQGNTGGNNNVGTQPTWVGPYGVLRRTNPFMDAAMTPRNVNQFRGVGSPMVGRANVAAGGGGMVMGGRGR